MRPSTLSMLYDLTVSPASRVLSVRWGRRHATLLRRKLQLSASSLVGGGPLCSQCLYYASRNVFPRDKLVRKKHVKTLQYTTMCHCTRSVEGVASIEQLSRLQCAGYFRPRDLCTQKFLLMEVAFIEGRKKLSSWGCLVVRRLCVFFPDPTLMGIYDVAEAAA